MFGAARRRGVSSLVIPAALRRQWFMRACRRRGPSLWRNVRGFCLFAGYGRSGHSAIASVIDAHPQAAVSHELDAVARYLAGVSGDDLFSEIVWLTREQARAGRTSRAPTASLTSTASRVRVPPIHD